ncbi:class I adenylate-forming enzyme family protein [Enhygromyxa salina]|uniref:Dimodular nonribosomal peptide synthase n=1 Tax=Enhygromyxa salina TaxID=215803 RepID=A0A2S9YTP9_9BACT|nr:fatty acid--CoA ligase family protein [Enhygromyxa salina]PRQ08464.1 Dimodular nonribosomal peptide synthase [Enhygromyxa salina]
MLAYAAFAQPLARIEAALAQLGVTDDSDPILFECANTVPGLLTLLALLTLERSFVLVPPPRPGLDLPAPAFCRWRLRTNEDADTRPDAPASFLRAEPIADHQPLPADSKLRSSRLLLRTSGSLGSPKLVVHTHDGALANACNTIERLGLRADDRVFIPVPVAHMFGLGAALLPALVVGASVEVLANANLLRYLERERSFAPTVAYSTPNLCATLVRPRAAPAHYRHVVVAGDKLSPELFAKLETIYTRVVSLYGSTELGVICAADPREAEGPRAATVGHPLPGVELELELELGTNPSAEGELVCRHPFPFESYVDASGALIQSPSGSSFATRDLARIHEGGLVELLGRCDHAVKRDGRLVALAQVERALERLPMVARAAVVVAAEQTPRGRAIAAFCVAVPGSSIDAAQVRDACRDSLPAYAIPDRVVELEALPLLASGKLDRHTLAQQLTPTPGE